MIRPAIPADAQAMVRIYNHYVLHSKVTFEEKALTPEEMAARIQQSFYLVGEVDGEVRAFAGASEWKGRSAYRFTRETSIYVESGYAGSGIATPLFRALLDQLRERGYHSAVATIAGSNQRSIHFHEKVGFIKKGQLDAIGYKFGEWIDAGYWQLMLTDKEEVPMLQSSRLDMIRIGESGAEGLFAIRSHPEVSLFTRRPLDRSVADTRAFVQKIEAGIESREWLYWMIKEKQSGKVVGTLCLWHFDETRSQAEVGYELHPDFWGRGYTTEALDRLLRYAFEEMALKELRAYTDQGNHASIRVLEKCGFIRRGTAEERGPDGQRILYAIFALKR